MSTDNEQKTTNGLRHGPIRGPWAYVIVAATVVVVLYALAVLVSVLT